MEQDETKVSKNVVLIPLNRVIVIEWLNPFMFIPFRANGQVLIPLNRVIVIESNEKVINKSGELKS